MTTIYTIGFTKKDAETFFGKIKDAGVKTLIDIRLKNTSGLAGFAKRDDLRFFLNEICNCGYRHETELAPTEQILDDYKKKKIDWNEYVVQFSKLIRDRKIENKLTHDELDQACFLCSEPVPNQCHRRLVAEYFRDQLGDIEIVHL